MTQGYCFVLSANFYGVNSSITVDLKLPTWCHQTLSWEKICTIGSSKLKRSSSSEKLKKDWQYLLYIRSTMLKQKNCLSSSSCPYHSDSINGDIIFTVMMHWIKHIYNFMRKWQFIFNCQINATDISLEVEKIAVASMNKQGFIEN